MKENSWSPEHLKEAFNNYFQFISGVNLNWSREDTVFLYAKGVLSQSPGLRGFASYPGSEGKQHCTLKGNAVKDFFSSDPSGIAQ